MGYVQLIFDNTNRAKKVLKAIGTSCYEERVLHLTFPNVPERSLVLLLNWRPKPSTSEPAIKAESSSRAGTLVGDLQPERLTNLNVQTYT
jgi:hypothetical protein